jgi:hypothetical protein
MKQAANRVLLPLKCWLAFNGLHVILSEKKELFLTTAVAVLKKMGKS